jgi:hypothetical protein
MTPLFLTTIISCTQAVGIIHKLTNVVRLTEIQKKEILVEIKKIIPSCPVKIENK